MGVQRRADGGGRLHVGPQQRRVPRAHRRARLRHGGRALLFFPVPRSVGGGGRVPGWVRTCVWRGMRPAHPWMLRPHSNATAGQCGPAEGPGVPALDPQMLFNVCPCVYYSPAVPWVQPLLTSGLHSHACPWMRSQSGYGPLLTPGCTPCLLLDIPPHLWMHSKLTLGALLCSLQGLPQGIPLLHTLDASPHILLAAPGCTHCHPWMYSPAWVYSVFVLGAPPYSPRDLPVHWMCRHPVLTHSAPSQVSSGRRR